MGWGGVGGGGGGSSDLDYVLVDVHDLLHGAIITPRLHTNAHGAF